MSNKTPFELRAELLAMARDHLQKQYEANLEFSKQLWEKSIQALEVPAKLSAEQITKFNKDLLDQMAAFMPKPPTVEEIMKKAQEFYSFVQKKE